jgi:multidrug resistance efflux pump
MRIVGGLLAFAIVAAALLALALVMDASYKNPRTDDAYVRANVIGIAPHVQGPLVELGVVDNQAVKAGDLLFVIDPRPYRAELARAEGEVLLVKAEVAATERAIEAARAEVARLKAEAGYAASHVRRLEPLTAKDYVSQDQFQDARSRGEAAAAAVRQAEREVERQQRLLAQFGDVNARLKKAEAAVDLARLNVEYCEVRAPFDARVTNLNIAVGDYARVGQQVFALVDDRVWFVSANFRETYLQRIAPGMTAEVNLVGYPGQTFRGVVQGIGWGVLSPAGADVGVLPKVEPTLNWARLAQRIPVRIILPPSLPAFPYRMGMTAVVTVRGFESGGARDNGAATQPSQ